MTRKIAIHKSLKDVDGPSPPMCRMDDYSATSLALLKSANWDEVTCGHCLKKLKVQMSLESKGYTADTTTSEQSL